MIPSPHLRASRYGGQAVYLLGITCNIHESSAAIVRNGVLVAAAEEERFTRRKHDNRFPAQAIAYCLREAGISMREVSYAGFYWQPWKGLLSGSGGSCAIFRRPCRRSAVESGGAGRSRR